MAMPEPERVEFTPAPETEPRLDLVAAPLASPAERYTLLARAAADLGYRVLKTVESLPGLAEDYTADHAESRLALLTQRERQILEFVAQGKSNIEIAQSLWVVENTVKFHLTNIYKKLGTRNRTEAAQLIPPNAEIDEITKRYWETLTPREREVLELVKRGLADKEIAEELALTKSTIFFHLSSVYRKLSVKNRTQATAIAQVMAGRTIETKLTEAKSDAETAAKSLFTAGSLASLDITALSAEAVGVPTVSGEAALVMKAAEIASDLGTKALAFANHMSKEGTVSLPVEPEYNPLEPILTKREYQILDMVSTGMANGEIARELWVVEQTVKFHLSNVYRKLGVANRTEASKKYVEARASVQLRVANRETSEDALMFAADFRKGAEELSDLSLEMSSRQEQQTLGEAGAIAQQRPRLLAQIAMNDNGAMEDSVDSVDLGGRDTVPFLEDGALLIAHSATDSSTDLPKGFIEEIKELEEILKNPPPHEEIMKYLRSRGWFESAKTRTA